MNSLVLFPVCSYFLLVIIAWVQISFQMQIEFKQEKTTKPKVGTKTHLVQKKMSSKLHLRLIAPACISSQAFHSAGQTFQPKSSFLTLFLQNKEISLDIRHFPYAFTKNKEIVIYSVSCPYFLAYFPSMKFKRMADYEFRADCENMSHQIFRRV